MNNEFLLDLKGTLQQTKTRKQLNDDIKQIEKSIHALRITGVFAKGETKKSLNAYINQLSGRLSTLKLKAKIDNRNLKREMDSALNAVKFKDIDMLNIDENKTRLKVKKAIADVKSYVEKVPVTVNIQFKKEKLDNDLTTYLNRNTKISESTVLLKEADKVRSLIGAINDKKSLREATDALALYKSEVSATGFNTKSTTDKIKGMIGHVTKIGGILGVASLAMDNFKRSVGTLKEIDSILTEISKTSDLTAQQLEKLGDSSFKSASKYGKTASDYLLGIQEMSRSGFYGDKGTAMAEQSLLAQAAGDMSAELANKYILATNAAYKYNGEAEKLNAVLDGQNSITNRNSVGLEDMAEAMSEAGTVASSYRVSVEDLSAMIGTIEAVTKSGGSEVGNSLKSILINLQNITSDKIVTTLNSANASMTEFVNGAEKLRNPIDILRDLSKTFNQLDEDDALRAEILTNIGGKHQATKLAALLQNMDMFDKMLVDYSEGSGSAMEEAMKSANNWEGTLNKVQNSFDGFINTLVNKDTVIGGLSFFDRLIQGATTLTDTVGEIPVVFTTLQTAMTMMNKDYGITQIWDKEQGKVSLEGNMLGIDFSNIKNMKNHFSEAEEAITKWNGELASGQINVNDFENSLVKNNAQFKDYLSTCKGAPASLEGYKSYLNSIGVSTDALRLKTVLMNSAISIGVGFAMQAAMIGIQAAGRAIDDYIHRLDNAKEDLSATQSELSSVNKEIDDTTDQIMKLEALDPSSLSITDKEDLQRLKDQNEELKIRQKYLEDQEKADLQKVADLTKEKYGQKYGNTDHEAVDQYKSLYKDKDTESAPVSSYLTGGNSMQSMPYAAAQQETGYMRGSGTLADLIAQYEYYTELKKEAVQNKDVASIGEYETKLTGIAQKLRDDRKELQGFSDDLSAAGDTGQELENITWQLKMIDDLLLSPGQNFVNFINKDSLSETRQQLVDLVDSGKLTQDELSANFSEVDNYLRENGLTLEDLISVMRTYNDEIVKASDQGTGSVNALSASKTIDQINTQLKPAFDALKSAYQGIFTDDNEFDLNSVDILSTCDTIKSKLDEMSKAGLNVDYSAYEDLIGVLNNTESTEESVEKKFNALAASVTQAALSGAEDFNTMKAALEDLDIANSEFVAFAALTSNTEALKEAGIDLMDTTEEEMQAFVNQSVSAEYAGEALALLQLKKLLVNSTSINTATDIQNVINLASAAGMGADVLTKLANAKSILGKVESGETVSLTSYEKALSDVEEAKQDILDWKPVEIDFPGAAKGVSKAAKETEKEVDIMAELNSEMDKYQSKLDAVKDARETYNKYGKITVDQAQDIVDADFKLLAAYGDEEAALESLGQAKLNEMQIQLARNAIDTINNITSEAEATEYLAGANEHLVGASLSATEAMLQQAVAAAKVRGAMQGQAADTILKGYQNGAMMLGQVDFGFKIPDEKKEKDSKKEAEKEKDFSKQMDWIERLLNRLNKATEKLKDSAEKFVSWWRKNNALDKAMRANRKEISGNEDVYYYYLKKANGVGLGKKYKKLVQDGSIRIQDVKDEGLAEKIEKYQEWYDKAQDCKDTIEDLYDAEREMISQKYDNMLEFYDSLDEKIQSVINKVESLMGLKEARGKRIDINDLLEEFDAYEDVIGQMQEMGKTSGQNKDDHTGIIEVSVSNRDLNGEITEAVKQSAIYKGLLSDIEKLEAKREKKGKLSKTDTAKLESFYAKRKELEEKATADTIVQYNKTYDAFMKLQAKLNKGQSLSKSQRIKYDQYKAELDGFEKQRQDQILDLQKELDNVPEKITDPGQSYEKRKEEIRSSYESQISDAQNDVRNTKQYKALKAEIENLEATQAKKGLSKSKQEKLDAKRAELAALERGATSVNISEYIKAYERFTKLSNKKTLNKKERSEYDTLSAQLKQWDQSKQDSINQLREQMNDTLENLASEQGNVANDAASSLADNQAKAYETAKKIAEIGASALQSELDVLDSYMSKMEKRLSLYQKFGVESLKKLGYIESDLDTTQSELIMDEFKNYLKNSNEKRGKLIGQRDIYQKLIDSVNTHDYDEIKTMYEGGVFEQYGDTFDKVIALLKDNTFDGYSLEWVKEWEQSVSDIDQSIDDIKNPGFTGYDA